MGKKEIKIMISGFGGWQWQYIILEFASGQKLFYP
jgi:hypothetical protein